MPRFESDTLKRMALGLFVTGTDTGVGKTLISCALLRMLRTRGMDAVGYKPIVTGCENGRWSDADALHAASDRIEPLERICPLRFHAPMAPVPAAALEEREIDLDAARSALERLAARHACVVAEGIGGLLVPLDKRTLVADFIGARAFRVVLVAKAQLGTVNHTLLTLNELHRRGLDVAAVIMNVTRPEDADNAQASRAEIERHAGRAIDATLPYFGGDVGTRLAAATQYLQVQLDFNRLLKDE